MLNEAATLDALLDQLLPLRDEGCELVLVDGGSDDGTLAVAGRRVAAGQLLRAREVGRAQQMRAGMVASEDDDIVWFLHVDSQVGAGALGCIREAALRDKVWGRFDVRLSGEGWAYRMVEWFMNWRSAVTGICTGDQGIFVTAEALRASGGVPLQPLMEDIELSARLKRYGGRPARIRAVPITTSSRKWEQGGIARTIVLMWCLRLAYFFGVSPDRLAKLYYPSRNE